MRRIHGFISVSLVIFVILLAMPALAFDSGGLADRFNAEVTEESVLGKSYPVVVFFSTGGVSQDCFTFEEDGTFYSTRGLEGTWTEEGHIWSADTLFAGCEEIDLEGISVSSLLVGRGTSAEGYTFFLFGRAGECVEDPVEVQGNTYMDLAK